MKNRGLGRGLSSLLKEELAPVEITKASNLISLDLIEPNEDQPRKFFDENKIKELSSSILNHGLVQPIVVSKKKFGKYKIVAGERRYRACKLAGLTEVPVIEKNLTEKEILEVALIENIQRQELTAIEESEGFKKLMDEYGYSQVELASAVGKSRSHVANLLRLNQLPIAIKNMINEGHLNMGHARCLIGIENAEELANKIISEDLTVRQVEELVNEKKNRKNRKEKIEDNNDNEDLLILCKSLSEKFGVKVVVNNSSNNGKITFHYSSPEELDSILEYLK